MNEIKFIVLFLGGVGGVGGLVTVRISLMGGALDDWSVCSV